MLDPRQRVRVYWNYRHRCYSLFQGGAVRASARQVELAEVEFHVRESGRQKMLREKRKVIHAFAVGRLVGWVHPSEPRDLAPFFGTRVGYDPHVCGAFICLDSAEPVHCADAARFDEHGVHIAVSQPAAA